MSPLPALAALTRGGLKEMGKCHILLESLGQSAQRTSSVVFLVSSTASHAGSGFDALQVVGLMGLPVQLLPASAAFGQKGPGNMGSRLSPENLEGLSLPTRDNLCTVFP